MGLKVSIDAKLYYLAGTRGSWGTDNDGIAEGVDPGTLTEIDIVKDLTVPIEKDKADVSTRRSKFKATKGTLRGISIDIPMIYDSEDAGFLALQKAFLTDIVIPMAMLDGDVSTVGTRGLWADFEVTKLEKGEQLADAQTVVFTVEPAYGAVPPEWVEVVAP